MTTHNPASLMGSHINDDKKPRVVLMYAKWDPRYKQRAERLRLSKNAVTIIDATALQYPEPGTVIEFCPCVSKELQEKVFAVYASEGEKIDSYVTPDDEGDPILRSGGSAPVRLPSTDLIEIPANWENLPWFGRRALSVQIGALTGDTSGLSKAQVHEIIDNEVKRRRALNIEPYSEPVKVEE